MIEVTDVAFCSRQLSKTFVALWYVTIIVLQSGILYVYIVAYIHGFHFRDFLRLT